MRDFGGRKWNDVGRIHREARYSTVVRGASEDKDEGLGDEHCANTTRIQRPAGVRLGGGVCSARRYTSGREVLV